MSDATASYIAGLKARIRWTQWLAEIDELEARAARARAAADTAAARCYEARINACAALDAVNVAFGRQISETGLAETYKHSAKQARRHAKEERESVREYLDNAAVHRVQVRELKAQLKEWQGLEELPDV